MLAPTLPKNSMLPTRQGCGAAWADAGSLPLRDAVSGAATPHERVDRRTGLSQREFRRDYLEPRRPVVVTDVVRGWPALRMFTPEFFLRNFADARAHVRGRSGRLGDLLRQQLASGAGRPAPDPCTLRGFADLLPYLTPRFAASLPSRHASRLLPRRVFELVEHLEISFAGKGSGCASVRHDMLRRHGWVAQVYGERQFTIYERGQEPLLYVRRLLPWLSAVRDPDDHAAWPLLRRARRRRVLLRAGDALFIPAGSWHASRSASMSITIAFDQLEAGNWREFTGAVVAEQRRSGRRFGALALGAWLRAIGPLLNLLDWFGAHRRRDWGPD